MPFPSLEDVIGLTWRGEWQKNVTYFAKNTVTYNGSIYICTAAGGAETPPTDTATWSLFKDHPDVNATLGSVPSTGLDISTIPNIPASKISSILGAAHGGTGVDTSAAANGSLLIGTGSGLVLATLTQGSGITITNTSGHITIAASGSSGDLKKLDEVIVGVGGQASIAFNNIDQGYRSLALHFSGRGDTAASYIGLQMQLNGDTSTNYDSQEGHAGGTGSSFSQNEHLAQTSWTVVNIAAASSPTNGVGTAHILLHNYASTTFRKAFTGDCFLDLADTSGNKFVYFMGGTWRSTAAITSILLYPAAGNFVQGSVASLYGLK